MENPKEEYQTCKCGSNWFNTTVADKPYCFRCGESVKEESKQELERGINIIHVSKPKQRLEKYSERFENNSSEIGNPETWGKRKIKDLKKETIEEFISEVTKNFKDEMSIKFTSGGIKLGAKWKAERICNSEVLQKIRASKSDAEARRIIRTI